MTAEAELRAKKRRRLRACGVAPSFDGAVWSISVDGCYVTSPDQDAVLDFALTVLENAEAIRGRTMTPGIPILLTLEQRADAIASAGALPSSPIWQRTRDEALRQLDELDRAHRDGAIDGLEQVAVFRSQGMTPGDALAAMGEPVPILPTWADVAAAVARRTAGAAPASR